jgi:hypothetical protein
MSLAFFPLHRLTFQGQSIQRIGIFVALLSQYLAPFTAFIDRTRRPEVSGVNKYESASYDSRRTDQFIEDLDVPVPTALGQMEGVIRMPIQLQARVFTDMHRAPHLLISDGAAQRSVIEK